VPPPNLTAKKGIAICLIASVMLSVPFVVEGCIETGGGYSLSLAARTRFSTIILTATLKPTEGHEKEAVARAIIHFYLCNRYGRNLEEIGQNVTKKDGTATFSWSAPGNGNYWFIAAYAASTAGGKTITVTS
jgi:dihydroorotate dehydrogenase